MNSPTITISLAKFHAPPLVAIIDANSALQPFDSRTRLVAKQGFIIDSKRLLSINSPEYLWVTLDRDMADKIFPDLAAQLIQYPKPYGTKGWDENGPAYRYTDGQLQLRLRRWFGFIYSYYGAVRHMPRQLEKYCYEHRPRPVQQLRPGQKLLLDTLTAAGVAGDLSPRFLSLEIGPGHNPLPQRALEPYGMAAWLGVDMIADPVPPVCSVPCQLTRPETLRDDLQRFQAAMGLSEVIALAPYVLHHLDAQSLQDISQAIGDNGILFGNFSGRAEGSEFNNFVSMARQAGFNVSRRNIVTHQHDGIEYQYIVLFKENTRPLARHIAQYLKAIVKQDIAAKPTAVSQHPFTNGPA